MKELRDMTDPEIDEMLRTAGALVTDILPLATGEERCQACVLIWDPDNPKLVEFFTTLDDQRELAAIFRRLADQAEFGVYSKREPAN